MNLLDFLYVASGFAAVAVIFGIVLVGFVGLVMDEWRR